MSTTYTAMRQLGEEESRENAGKYVPVSRPYARRHAAFDAARRYARAGYRVRVWEHSGPGSTVWHEHESIVQ